MLIPEELEAKLRKAAQRRRMSKGQFVRQAIEASLRDPDQPGTSDPLARLQSLGAPTADIEQMLAEIEAGRS